ncbi:unnamed protein product [Cuscuta epithymum]|uniref:EF-hand domain-containing protein n=1 Tax=Cuscuta epithymum TaxID=186058 RepID=A0AAV0CUA6_9ASTE|nr:unnamed protein product [Cuscuta epithymum]
MNSLGPRLSERHLQRMIKDLDKDANETVNYDEFRTLILKWLEKKAECIDAFKTLDTNGDGHISVDELRKGMHNLKVKLTDEELNMMIEEADTDENGGLNYKEFADILISKKLQQYEKREDHREECKCDCFQGCSIL